MRAEIVESSDPFSDRVNARIGFGYYSNEVFSRDGTVARMYRVPPLLQRILHVIRGLSFLGKAFN